jgi:hypothetical protein
MVPLFGFRGLTIASTLGVALGCAGANMTTYAPVSQKTKFSEDSLYSAARDAAEQLGYNPRVADGQSHSLDTREQQVAISNVPRLSYKYSFHIETGGGVLSIAAACVKNSATSEKTFSDCGDDRPERVVHAQSALKKRILELAPRADANTPDWGSFGKPEAEADKDAPPDAKDKAGKDAKPDKGAKPEKATKPDKAAKPGKAAKPVKAGDKDMTPAAP